MYDLMVAAPHDPPDERFHGAEWDAYRTGYEWGLVMALRTMDHAERRYRLYVNTRRLETRRRNAERKG